MQDGVGLWAASDEGQETITNNARDFKPVTLPDSSLELTEVPEAPVGQLDSSDSDYLNVDMQGRPIDEGDDGQGIETPSPENGNNEAGNNPTPRNNNAPQQRTPQRNPNAEEMRQVSNIGKRFVVDSVGLDVQLGAVNEVDNLIRPTNFTGAFLVRNKGIGENLTKAKQGTAYVVMHATDAGSIAPGNFLVDNTTRNNRAKIGDIVEVGNLKYKITDYKREGKDLIANDKNLWNGKIGKRLIIITCFPNSADNAVFVGELVS